MYFGCWFMGARHGFSLLQKHACDTSFVMNGFCPERVVWWRASSAQRWAQDGLRSSSAAPAPEEQEAAD